MLRNRKDREVLKQNSKTTSSESEPKTLKIALINITQEFNSKNLISVINACNALVKDQVTLQRIFTNTNSGYQALSLLAVTGWMQLAKSTLDGQLNINNDIIKNLSKASESIKDFRKDIANKILQVQRAHHDFMYNMTDECKEILSKANDTPDGSDCSKLANKIIDIIHSCLSMSQETVKGVITALTEMANQEHEMDRQVHLALADQRVDTATTFQTITNAVLALCNKDKKLDQTPQATNAQKHGLYKDTKTKSDTPQQEQKPEDKKEQAYSPKPN